MVLSNFTKIVVPPWETFEAASKQRRETSTSITVGSSIGRTLAPMGQQTRITVTEQLNITIDRGTDEFPMSIPLEFSNRSLHYNMGMQHGYA